ncbi:zinc-binding dehydrogenase [Luteimonas chenhongjianii]|uniref:zinc-binding dehydrogenase n=1 Tax=Luteimonas chenhongjianii TaxID=2006110 RepID=UPI001C9E8AE0|nr:zinc-binding dehydrogenase [Luteimonas chenhongjianii]
MLTGVDSRLPLGLALGRQLRLQALIVGSRRQQQDMIRALEASDLRPVIDRHFPLEELVAAFQHQAAGRHFGKIVLDL